MTKNQSSSSRLWCVFAFILSLFIITLNGRIAIAEDPPGPGPVEVGGSCTESDQIYHSLTSTRTPWKITELSAVPVGTTDPQQWEEYPSFKTQLLQVLQQPEDSAAFAQACGSIWRNFFSNDADVLVTLGRTITGTDEILECQSDIWVLTSTQATEQDDVSEWLQIGTLDVSSDTSTTTLEQLLQSLLDQLNSQPGG